MFPAALNASASSGVGATGAAGLVGFDLCGGGTGPSPLTGVPFIFGAGTGAGAGAGVDADAGASKAPGIFACGAAGGGETGPSESISIGSDIMDSAESLFLSASLRFNGCVSTSRSALRREPWLDLAKVLDRLLCEEEEPPCSLRYLLIFSSLDRFDLADADFLRGERGVGE